ncbi:MAG: hypothetical protein ACOC4M_09680 [Promethearchaeia archaeon]
MTNNKLSIAWCILFIIAMIIGVFSDMVLGSELGYNIGLFIGVVVILLSCPVCILDSLLTRRAKEKEKKGQQQQVYSTQQKEDLELERKKIELEKEKLKYQQLRQQTEKYEGLKKGAMEQKADESTKKYCSY